VWRPTAPLPPAQPARLKTGTFLLNVLRHQANINLEIISGEEEARLVRVATLRALRNLDPPRFILDLGGGSLEPQ